MNYDEIIRDFRTKYRHTYVFLDLPGQSEKSLAYVEEVAAGNNREDAIAKLNLNTLAQGRLVMNMASVGRFKFHFPPIGSFQYGRDSVLMLRTPPHRQYTRGVGSTNHMLVMAMAQFDMARSVAWSLSVVDAAYKAQKYHAREAVDLLNKGRHRSVALPGRFTMALPIDERPEFMLLHDYNLVGRVSSKLEFTPARGAEVFEEEAVRVIGEF